MVLDAPGTALRAERRPLPEPGPDEVLIDVAACGVCRTDLHIVDGELEPPRLPLVPGHEIVGRVRACGARVRAVRPGDRVGVPWLGHTCERCPHCLGGAENLCDAPGFTGYTRDGGYAEACVADARYVLRLPEGPDDVAMAPWLCAGLIGYRALKLAGRARRIGIYGFGAAAHLVTQIARFDDRRVHAFTRPGDEAARRFALAQGCDWAGASTEAPPEPLDAALIFAPVGGLVPRALQAVRKGGVVVCGGIHMSDIPSFPYALLWGERSLRSVANLTRADGDGFLAVAVRAGLRAAVEPFALEDANEALLRLREGRLTGAAVLVP